MAWEWLDNVDELIGQCGGSSTSGHTWGDILNAMNTSYTDMLSDVWGNALDIQGSGIYYLGDDGNQSKQYLTTYNLRIQLGTVWSDWSPGCVRIQKMSEPMLGMTRNGNTTTATFRFMVNYATEEITAWCIVQYDNQYTQFQNMISSANRANCALWYDFLKDHSAPPITYNWQSVPSISGKNGILSLATLKEESINDGEPVSGAAVSVFDQNPVSGNNVKDIVDGNTPLIPSAVDVTAAFIISNPPVGELASRILAAKKGSIPESIEDADKTVSIPANASNVTMPGLDENSQYYFAIFVADATGDTAVSDPKDIYTSADEGWNFDYTGEIQIFVAPKTGIYQLETWGAQGGDATDGTNSARGGYGAYAYGEVLLTQGETLYINVGGQNGYGGGGNPTNIIPIEASVLSNAYKSSYSNSTTPENVGTDYYDSFPDVAQYFETDTCITTGESSKQQLSNDNGSIKFTQPNPYDIMSYTVIPLGGTYNVTNISFAYSKTINTGQIYVGANYNRLCIAIVKIVNAKIQSIDWVFDERENVNKSNVSIDESINAEGNYILIHEASGTVLINDLVLTVR